LRNNIDPIMHTISAQQRVYSFTFLGARWLSLIFLHSEAASSRVAEKVTIAHIKYVKFRNRPKYAFPQPLALFYADVTFEFSYNFRKCSRTSVIFMRQAISSSKPTTSKPNRRRLEKLRQQRQYTSVRHRLYLTFRGYSYCLTEK